MLSSLSLGRDTGMITLVSPDIIETPGIISGITEPLRKNNINIVEITSSQTAVVLFVDWKDFCEGLPEDEVENMLSLVL